MSKLTIIRFALNSAKCSFTSQTAAYLMFEREPRTTEDITHDFRSIVENGNFIPEINSYLKKKLPSSANRSKNAWKFHKTNTNNRRIRNSFRPHHVNIGDKVWVKVHPHNQASKNRRIQVHAKARWDAHYFITEVTSILCINC